MIFSMTGFARERVVTEQGELSWEIRTVNHRHLDVSVKLPEAFRDLDPQVREMVRQHISRGKVDVLFNFHPTHACEELTLNATLVKQLLATAQQVQALNAAATPLSTFEILRWPGVLQASEPDMEQLRHAAMQTFAQALTALSSMRQREGEKIHGMLSQRVEQIQTLIARVAVLLPEIQQSYQAKIQQRFAEAKLELDPARLAQEMVLLIQRSDVAEEVDRLGAHCQEMLHGLKQGGAVGRRLDFLMQEFNREANTLGSKSVSAQTTKISVELKVLIEQMREQVQNLE